MAPEYAILCFRPTRLTSIQPPPARLLPDVGTQHFQRPSRMKRQRVRGMAPQLRQPREAGPGRISCRGMFAGEQRADGRVHHAPLAGGPDGPDAVRHSRLSGEVPGGRDVVGRRRIVRVGFVASLSLDLSLDFAEVLLQLPEIVVRQHDRMPAVRLGSGHGPLWTFGLACQMGGRNWGVLADAP